VITAVTGRPGAGKSFRFICAIGEQLAGGGFVATNLPLKPDWAEILARGHVLRRLVPGRVDVVAERYRRRTFLSGDVAELLRALPGCGRCGFAADLTDPHYCVKGHPLREGRGLWVLDEAHEELNSRTWGDDDRLRVVKWVSRSRHRGWHVMFGTQALASLDKQLRDRVEYEEILRNLRNAQLFGIPVSPVPAFASIKVWVGGPQTQRHVAKRRLYFLDGRKSAYDTHGLARLDPEELAGAPPIVLPLPDGHPLLARPAHPRRSRERGRPKRARPVPPAADETGPEDDTPC
jgi:hypothetical protein